MSNDQPREQTPKTDYASNSKKSKEKAAAPEQSDETRVERIEGLEVVERKKSLGRKMVETFTGDDVHSVGQYLLLEVMVPAAKTLITDMVSQGIERMLYGDSRPRRGSSSGGATRVNYGGYYGSGKDDRVGRSTRTRSSEVRELVFTQRHEAMEVIERLEDAIDKYGSVSVADLYSMVGVTGHFTDHKWGWKSMRDARVQRVHEGFMLDLPRTRAVDD